MNITISPAQRIFGQVHLPGDKSISHRLALLGAIATGLTTIENFASSQDCHSTLHCLSDLGVVIEERPHNQVLIHGRGLDGLKPPLKVLDAGNSGSTIRMLSGILAGQTFPSTITGDESLQRRPMKRVITPLKEMGCTIEAMDGNFPPLTIRGGNLKPIRYALPVASAQVKSAILLAGLYAHGTTTVLEPTPTRNHTELALQEFGATLAIDANSISIAGRQRLRGVASTVPGDISSAAFFLAAATLLPHSEIQMRGVGISAGRRGIVDTLCKMGANIELMGQRFEGGEPIGDLCARTSQLSGGRLAGQEIPGVIDEIPILAVLGTQTARGIEFRDASELRVKESDRIRSIVDNLRAMGAVVQEFPDGLFVAGRQSLRGAHIQTHGDHRIAMAFAVAGLIARGETVIQEAECAGVSFPDFFATLRQLIAN
ncbi:MAG: 3-phosphoshikimate 1-carboxyvinyltransferase [Terriglobia bacterium]